MIAFSLPVYAHEPAKTSGSFERRSILKLSPLKRSKNVLNLNTTGTNSSKRSIFVKDKELNASNKKFADKNQKVENFNKAVEQKPLSSKEIPVSKSQNRPDIEYNTKKSITPSVNIANWTIEDAQKNIFNNVSYVKDVSAFPKIDPNFKKSKRAMKRGLKKLEIGI